VASGSKKVIYAAMLGNSAIAVTKFIASAMTGSSAMLSEAIHSVVDTCNQLLLLWGLRQAKKPPDEEFPFGHGKEIYFWSFVVAIMIFALGAGISIYEGIKHLHDPHPVSNPMVNYIVLGLAMIFEGGAWLFAFKEFRAAKGKLGFIRAVREGKDPTLFVVLFEDSAAMLGLVIAFIGILLGQLTGIPYFDGAASVVIGLLLATVAAWLAHETKGLLIGEAAGSETRRELMALVESDPVAGGA
jgi:cation diffusion facilitator family transporter